MNTSLLSRRFSTRMLLVLALVPCTLALTRCRMVPDTLTGVDLLVASQDTRSRQTCVKNCHEQRKEAERAENQRHQAAQRACHSDKSCRKQEERRHKDALDDIRDQERKCRSQCYNEGDGRAGR
jgi:hypothetical protein